MKLDPEYLRQHYARLSDEALLEVDRGDLVEMARTIYDQEVDRRKLDADSPSGEPDGREEEAYGEVESYQQGEEPEWLNDAAEIYSHAVQSASAESPAAVLDARDAIEDAGIPCYVDLSEIPAEESLQPHGTHRWRVMVPGKLNLQATSVLERAIFNAEFEAGWKAHLENLSDAELRAADPQVVLCGLFDRIARVKRVYDRELSIRRLK
jgi:hypothetical protein